MLHDGESLALTSEECQEDHVPTYQYQCTECREGLEVVQKFTDDALTECPTCAGRLKKVFSAVGIVFKGSGFYRNDSRGSSGSGSGSSSGGSNSSSADSAVSKPKDTTAKAGSEKPAEKKSGTKSDSGPASSSASTAAAPAA
jgi:putative FmdB family regulatory protein